MTQLLAYWLLPKESIRTEFARLIEDLAQQHDAPVFAPHVTVHAESFQEKPDPAAIRTVLEAAADGLSPMTLKITGIGTSKKFTKSLFVEFAEYQGLSALAMRIREMTGSQSRYELHPHLSLLYAQLPATKRQALARRVRLPFAHCEFDRIAAIAGAARTNSRKDVQSWRILAEATFH